MRIDCKITSRIYSSRLFLSLFFIALSISGCLAQEDESQNIAPESYFGATINYRNYPHYSDFSRVVIGQSTTSTFESRNGIDFGLSYEKQVKKNWYYELSIPYLRFTNDRSSTTEVVTGGGGSMPATINLLAGETIQNLDITARSTPCDWIWTAGEVGVSI